MISSRSGGLNYSLLTVVAFCICSRQHLAPGGHSTSRDCCRGSRRISPSCWSYSAKTKACYPCDWRHCAHSKTRATSPQYSPRGLEGPAMLKIVVLGCVLAAIAVTLKIRLETPEGRQPLARALVTIHLQQMRDQEALP